jgi:predicted NUDIX family phosphoesterase
MKAEFIAAIEATHVNKLGVRSIEGEVTMVTSALPTIALLAQGLVFAQRERLEKDEDYRQIIPYCAILSDGKALVYKRTSKSGEKNLVDMVSIGFGGHLEIDDCLSDKPNQVDLEAGITIGLCRELAEELYLDCLQHEGFDVVGYIVGDKDVHALHLGLATTFTVDPERASELVADLEEGIDLVGFMSAEDILEKHRTEQFKLEDWSLRFVEWLSAQSK